MRLAMMSLFAGVMAVPLATSNGCGSSGDDDDDSGALVEREPNDSVSQANAMSLDTVVHGELDPSDIDVFRIQMPADFSGYKITVSVTDQEGLCFEGVDPNLEILAEDGITSLYWAEDAVENYCPQLVFPVTPSQVIYARVATAVSLAGEYTISVREGGTGTVTGVVTIANDSDSRNSGRRGVSADMAIMPGELLVRAPSMSRQALLHTLRMFKAEQVPSRLGGRDVLVRLPVPAGLTPEQARQWTLDGQADLERVPGILQVEPNRLMDALATVNDPAFDTQWDMKGYPGINAPAAWDITKGSLETVVAVIDTGHDSDHPDLVNKAVDGYDFISNAENAVDGDGPDDDPTDAAQSGHGTHVAGTIAAATNNGVGVAGAGYNVRYMPLRVCGQFGCTEADIIEALYYAAGFDTVAGPGLSVARAEVVNLSLGGNDYCSAPLQDAVAAAAARGVIVVAASGNNSEDAARHSPSNCSQVVTVGSSDSSARRSSFSNYGASLDIMAPGSNIYSTYPDNGYATLSGTSMATPHIAGVAALLKDVNPTFQFDSVLALLQTGARTVDCSGATNGCGAGLVDAQAAVTASLDREDDPVSPVILVQAVDSANSARVFTTVVQHGNFFLSSLPVGVWILQAGYDTNGDFKLDGDGASAISILSETITITEQGEDVGAINLTLP